MGIEITVDLSIEELAKIVTRLNKKEKEKLLLLLSGDVKKIGNGRLTTKSIITKTNTRSKHKKIL